MHVALVLPGRGRLTLSFFYPTLSISPSVFVCVRKSYPCRHHHHYYYYCNHGEVRSYPRVVGVCCDLVVVPVFIIIIIVVLSRIVMYVCMCICMRIISV